LDRLHAVKVDLDRQLEEVNRNILSLTNIKKQRKTLPEDKEAFLQEQMDTKSTLMAQLQKTQEDIQQIQIFLNSLKARGRVSASAKVYPGVKIMVRDVMEEVRTEYKAVTFILENGLIRMTKYEEPDEAAKKGPDGYTTH